MLFSNKFLFSFFLAVMFFTYIHDDLYSKDISKVPSLDNLYTAHEWGTFTSLSTSDGRLMTGLEVEEESLPAFVYSHSMFPGLFNSSPLVMYKRIPLRVKNVTIKMETPVIYFYTDQIKKPLKVNVDVRFNGGSISQWYPQRTSGESIGSLFQTLDFAGGAMGHINWNAEILPRDTKLKINTNKLFETKTWIEPRKTDSNLIKVGKQVEKYLFYRGLGNFKMSLKLSAPSKENVLIENSYDSDIPFAMVYEKKKGEKAKVWWSGAIKSKSKRLVKILGSDFDLYDDANKSNFINALVKAGLYKKEAVSMLKTWEHSYFEKPGFKVFWIVPRKTTDKILPLNLNPKPKSLERVLVGRSELMTKQHEELIVKEFANKKLKKQWEGHRFYKAYNKRVNELTKTKHPIK